MLPYELERFLGGISIVHILLLLFLACWPAAYIAKQKGRSMEMWFFAGLLFGPMAALMVGFSPALPPQNDEASQDLVAPPEAKPEAQTCAPDAPQPTVQQPAVQPVRSKAFCPGCGEPLGSDAMFCPGCGRKLC